MPDAIAPAPPPNTDGSVNKGSFKLDSLANYQYHDYVRKELVDRWVNKCHQTANDLAMNDIIEGLQAKTIPFNEETGKADLKKKDVEEMVIKRAEETSKELPAVYTKMRIKKLKIDLTEYQGKEVGPKKGPEMDTSQPMKTMLDVLQVTGPISQKNKNFTV